jgi:hypothetical protein
MRKRHRVGGWKSCLKALRSERELRLSRKFQACPPLRHLKYLVLEDWVHRDIERTGKCGSPFNIRIGAYSTIGRYCGLDKIIGLVPVAACE